MNVNSKLKNPAFLAVSMDTRGILGRMECNTVEYCSLGLMLSLRFFVQTWSPLDARLLIAFQNFSSLKCNST